MEQNGTVQASGALRRILYAPTDSLGFTAWVDAFDYQNGRLGLSFKELRRGAAPGFQPPKLEMGEAVGAPVSYCSAECGSGDVVPERVYMASDDGGETWHETGRCPLDQGSFLNVGFPDGRLVGLDVGRVNETRTGWCDYIAVRESCDGGNTWRETARLLEGCAVYLWRLRRLRDGSFLVLASFYGTPWGPGRERPTRNTMLPGETYLSKIQTFFLHSADGRRFTGPHYVLPGIGAHEYDAAELSDGSLLFLAGDVQATPVGRQLVRRTAQGFLNGPMLPIGGGAPPHPETDPQGGFVPETVVCLPGDILVGARRNKPYSCSGDLGANWTPIAGLPIGLYQPTIRLLPDGRAACFGHCGGDNAVGQTRMHISADVFRLEGKPPMGCRMTLDRVMREDGSGYLNRYAARLTCGGRPAAGRRVVFRFLPYWAEDGSVSVLPQDRAPIQIAAVTGANGEAWAEVPEFDAVRDIHFAYTVDVLAEAVPGQTACVSPSRCELAMTPRRRCSHPYDAYFAGNTLFLSPTLEAACPDCYVQLALEKGNSQPRLPDEKLRGALLRAGVLRRTEEGLRWISRVHGGPALEAALPQGDGDWYV